MKNLVTQLLASFGNASSIHLITIAVESFQAAGSLNKNRNVSLVFRFWTKDKNEKALIGNVLNISSDVFVVSSDVLLRVQMSTRSADSSFFLSIALQRVIVLQLQAKHYKVGTF